jgi:hypothetical protein
MNDEALQGVVEAVNEDRPFTPKEREMILTEVMEIARLLRLNERLTSTGLWVASALGFLAGTICAKVFP